MTREREPKGLPTTHTSPAAGWRARLLVVLVALSALVAGFLVGGVVRKSAADSPAASLGCPPPPAPSAPSSSTAPHGSELPIGSASPASSIVTRAGAAAGDLESLRRLELIPAEERTVAGSVALATGHLELRRREVTALEREWEEDPTWLGEPNTLARLFAFGRDPELYLDALPAIARLPGPLGPDMLYELAVEAPNGSNARLLAEDLLRDPAVVARASASLDVLLKLRASRACHRVRWSVEQVLERGDDRCVPVLEGLRERSGCGPDSKQDCYTCLRDDDLLQRAEDAAKERKAQRPWVFAR